MNPLRTVQPFEAGNSPHRSRGYRRRNGCQQDHLKAGERSEPTIAAKANDDAATNLETKRAAGNRGKKSPLDSTQPTTLESVAGIWRISPSGDWTNAGTVSYAVPQTRVVRGGRPDRGYVDREGRRVQHP